MSDGAMACAPVHVSDPPVWQRLGLGVLAEHIPTDLIDEVLTRTGRMQQRVRRSPARVTVLFILTLSLLSGMGYRGVWRELTAVALRRCLRRAGRVREGVVLVCHDPAVVGLAQPDGEP